MPTKTMIATLAALGLLAAPAAAQTDRPWGMGSALDAQERAANAFDRALDGAGRDAFARGYREGRAAERRRGDARPASGPGWNDASQGEVHERLELAAFQLRRALMLMHDEASLPIGNPAVVQARQALVHAQNAMTWLPAALEDRGASRQGRREGGGGGG